MPAAKPARRPRPRKVAAKRLRAARKPVPARRDPVVYVAPPATQGLPDYYPARIGDFGER